MTTAMNEDEPEIIVLQTEIGSPDDAPRGPIFNPFTAYLQNNQVVLESSESCGLVAVEITSTTGFYYSTVFDTEDGYIVMPISGNVGSYTLTSTMSSGDVFVGSFII
jgi:hypothetical protein